MREIKFRIWNKVKKDMIYLLKADTSITEGAHFAIVFEERNHSGEVYPIEDLEVLQFTGLHDNNGKEIYEGDYIKLHGGLRLEYYPDNGAVIYNISSFVMKAKNDSDVFQHFSLNYSDGTEIEVIGNIYENPELLK